MFSTWWVCRGGGGWVLVGFGRGLHCSTGEGDVPRLILAPCWEDPRRSAKACLSFKRPVEVWARKEPVIPWCTPVRGEQVCRSLRSWSNLPCPLQGCPRFSLSHSLRKHLSSLGLSVCALGLMDWCDTTVQLQSQKKWEERHSFFRIVSVLF